MAEGMSYAPAPVEVGPMLATVPLEAALPAQFYPPELSVDSSVPQELAVHSIFESMPVSSARLEAMNETEQLRLPVMAHEFGHRDVAKARGYTVVELTATPNLQEGYRGQATISGVPFGQDWQIIAMAGKVPTPYGPAQGYYSDVSQSLFVDGMHETSFTDTAQSAATSIIFGIPERVRELKAEIGVWVENRLGIHPIPNYLLDLIDQRAWGEYEWEQSGDSNVNGFLEDVTPETLYNQWLEYQLLKQADRTRISDLPNGQTQTEVIIGENIHQACNGCGAFNGQPHNPECRADLSPSDISQLDQIDHSGTFIEVFINPQSVKPTVDTPYDSEQKLVEPITEAYEHVSIAAAINDTESEGDENKTEEVIIWEYESVFSTRQND